MKAYWRKNRAFYRGVVALALPVALQNLLSASMSMVDTLMITSLGDTVALAAVGLCNQFNSLLFSFYWGFACGGTLFIAQYWGARDEDGICRAYGVTSACMMLVGVAFLLLGCLSPAFVLGFYTDKAQVAAVGVQYLRIMGLSFPAQVLAMALSALMRSTENVKSPLYASIACMVTNTLVNYLLIFGKFGLPALGVRGAAIGTVAGAYMNVLVLYVFVLRERHSFALRFKKQFRWDLLLIKAYFLKSLPIILNETLYGVGQMVVNRVLGHQDVDGIAAVAVFRVLEGLIFSFFIGLSSASSVMVGKQVGAGDLDGAYLGARRFARLCPAVTLVFCLAVLALRPQILSILGLTGAAHAYLWHMLLIYALGGPLRSANYIMNNMFRAGGEPVVGAALELGGLFLISVPLIYLTGMVWQLPFLWVFACIYSEDVAKTALSVWYLRSGRWVRPVTELGLKNLRAFRRGRHLSGEGEAV